MRTNREIRLIGKDSLRGNYLIAIANMFLIGLASFALNRMVAALTGTGFSLDAYAMQVSPGREVVSILLSLLVSFVVSLFGIGLQWGFLDIQDGKPMTVGHLGLPFRDQPLKVVGFVFLKSLLIGLWSLLLIIPGIVKSYSWAMAEFLYYDNPEVTNRLLLDKSEALMYGNRWKLFRLEFFYVFAYLIPFVIWVIVLSGLIEGNGILYGSDYAALFILFGGTIVMMIVTFILSFILEPKRNSARAAFYVELVGIEPGEAA